MGNGERSRYIRSCGRVPCERGKSKEKGTKKRTRGEGGEERARDEENLTGRDPKKERIKHTLVAQNGHEVVARFHDPRGNLLDPALVDGLHPTERERVIAFLARRQRKKLVSVVPAGGHSFFPVANKCFVGFVASPALR
jgi:hypothetical protein